MINMFLQPNTSQTFSFEIISQLIYFLRIHQNVYHLTIVITILFFKPETGIFQLLSAGLLIILITPTFLLLQDILGKKDDEKFNQKRIMFSDTYNKIFFITSMIVMLVILFLNNIESDFCFIALLFSTFAYGFAKHLRKMIFSYIFRYLSSIFTFSMYLFILTSGNLTNFYYFIIFVSIFDLIGNIAGDIRDVQKDTIAGVKTLVTVYGEDNTLKIMAMMMVISFCIFLYKYELFILSFLYLINLCCFILVELLSTKYVHGLFHLSKLVNFLIIASLINDISLFVLFIVLTCVVILWFFSYYYYLFNSGHSSHV